MSVYNKKLHGFAEVIDQHDKLVCRKFELPSTENSLYALYGYIILYITLLQATPGWNLI